MTIYPPCKYCGADHGMGIEDMITGHITPIDVCYTCLWKPFEESFKYFDEQVILKDEVVK